MDYDDFNNSVPDIEYFVFRGNTPEWTILPSLTHFIDLTYIVSGTAIYTVNGVDIQAEAGDLLCIPPDSERSAVSSSPAQFSCFATNFLLCNLSGEEVTLPLPLISNIGIKDDLIFHFAGLNADWLRRGPGFVMQVRSRFMYILHRIMEMCVYEVDTYGIDSRIKAAMRYIATNYMYPINIAQVAAGVSLNPIYFGALFKKETKTTFRNYVNNIRLNQAEGMLRVGKLNITEIAQMCGFSDVFYFSKIFKKYKGVPPSSVQLQ